MGVTMAGPPPPSFPLVAAAMTSLLLLPWAAPMVDALCDAGDKQILLDLKKSLGDPPALSSWTTDSDCCTTWGSMNCTADGRVSVVGIQSVKNVRGTLPESIGGLTYLEKLTIRNYASLSGPIPMSIGELTHLSELRLDRNGLTGSIPQHIGDLDNLVVLSLSHNTLSGDVPRYLINLDPKHVDLSYNKLSGDLSNLITWWKSIEFLDISHNAISFDIGRVMFPTGLKVLNLGFNQICGAIPKSADEMKGLQKLDVRWNKLCGEIPQGGVVNRFPASSFAGNKCLCGKPMTACWLTICPVSCRFGTCSSSSPQQVISLRWVQEGVVQGY